MDAHETYTGEGRERKRKRFFLPQLDVLCFIQAHGICVFLNGDREEVDGDGARWDREKERSGGRGNGGQYIKQMKKR